MKLKHRALALLLSAVMVLTYMPAMAFAAGSESKIPKSITFSGDTEYTPAYTDREGDTYDEEFDFRKAGNKLTITYDDGSSAYECKRYTYKDSDGDNCEGYAYVPEGEDPKLGTDEDGDVRVENKLKYLDWDFAGSGKIKITYEYEYTNEDGNDDWGEISTTFQGKYVNGIKYTGNEVTYEPWNEPEDADFYEEGREFTLTYSEGPSRKLVCKPYDENTEDGYTWKDYAFFFEDEEPIVKTDSEGYKYPVNSVDLEIYRDGYNASKGIPVYYRNVSTYVPVKEKVYPKPVSAQFVAPDGFAAYGLIGDKYVYSGNLLEKGNKFIISYSDNTQKEYVYAKKNGYYGFYCGEEELWSAITLNKRIPKGTHVLDGKIEIDNADSRSYKLPVKVKVKATQYYASTTPKTYTYTGKTITHKPVVKYWTGKKMKTMPKSWYTVKTLKKSKIGGYDYKVTIKKKYQKKYGTYIWGWWEIVPKAPAIKKVTAGSGKLTVTWTKFSKAAQKNINGFIVEVSTSSKFPGNKTDSYWVEKKTASKYTVNGLDKGKKYYVRVISFKQKKDLSYWSKPSKKKSVTVK